MGTRPTDRAHGSTRGGQGEVRPRWSKMGNPRFEQRVAVVLLAVHDEPGVHFRQLARTTGIREGALRHAIQVLANSGQVRASRHRNRLRFFPSSASASAIRGVEDTKAYVMRRVAEAPGVTHRDLMHGMGISRTTLDHHTSTLRARGHVVVVKRGRARTYWLPGGQRPCDGENGPTTDLPSGPVRLGSPG